MIETEVLVAGGGPTGLAAALALGRLGVRTVVAERRSGTSTHPRGHVENGRTMELFRIWGIEDEVREEDLPREFFEKIVFATRFAGVHLGDFPLPPDSEWLMGHDGKGPSRLASIPQDRLEPILLQAAEAQPSVEVRFATELTQLDEGGDGVTAQLRGPDGEVEDVRASYVVAADGPRSSIRESLGIGVQGPGTLGFQLGIYFHADLSRWMSERPSMLYWLYNPDVQGVVIALDGRDRWHMLFAYDAERESPEDYPPERCEALVRELIGDESVVIDVRSVLPWRMRATVAEHFRAGRVFLAGDAAHAMPPTGGMGMNTGIGDAHNLAWKLHAVLRGRAGEALLDTYAAEREPVGKHNVDTSVSNAVRMMESGLAGILVNDPEGFAHIEHDAGEPVRRRIADAIPGQVQHFCFDGSSFGACYESSAVVPDGTEPVVSDVDDYRPTARPGARAPHHWLELDGAEASTVDLSDNRFAVLTASEAWAGAARGLEAEVDLFVGHVGDDLRDVTGGWAEAYGVGDAGAVLIRPDGHVAWRTTEASSDGGRELQDALSHVLHR